MSDAEKYKLLIVDDDCDICDFLEGEYNDRFQVASVNSHQEAMDHLGASIPDIALVDLKLTENSDDSDPNESVGYDLIKRIRKMDDRVHIIVMTAHHRSTETAMKAVSLGANNYIRKPFVKAEVPLDTKIAEGIDRLVSIDRNARENGKPSPKTAKTNKKSGGVVISAPQQSMHQIIEIIDDVAKKDASILITGDTGVGKRYIAEMIYKKSGQAGEFVLYNCSSNHSTIESELFGHVKGAFTGAHKSKVGLIEKAAKGTLFLDEIGTMPLESQAKLLSFLDDRIVRPMGDTSGKKVKVRIISATNSAICEAISNGAFREDLFHRLNVVWLHIPPLRERKDEIPRLCCVFLRDIYGDTYSNKKRISREEAEKLKGYDWPGNIRELRNGIEKACCGKGRSVLACDIIGAHKGE